MGSFQSESEELHCNWVLSARCAMRKIGCNSSDVEVELAKSSISSQIACIRNEDLTRHFVDAIQARLTRTVSNHCQLKFVGVG